MKRSKGNFQYFGSLFKQFYLTSEAKGSCIRQLAIQMRRTKISLLPNLRKRLGNRSLTDVMKHSTITNWKHTTNDQNQSACINKKSQTPATSKPYMCVHAEQNKHQEEADGPELRQWHQGCCLGVCDECQARTFVGRGERALLFRIKFQSKKENADDDQEFHSDKI